ncbi:LysE family translocator [Humitalea sp. 24SJ18S-53]|uniref:LysE family translocator n=1 Tax=Humitalea sp. 24SJ18S-53 TaxID=3422307 RepID=UPI003D67CD5B
MFDTPALLLYIAAALLIAATPGPGIFYVAARSLAGGRGAGIASSFGTGLGGTVHIAAGAFGVSALVLASAEAFAMVKLAGALYLLWLGVRTIRAARQDPAGVTDGLQGPGGFRQAFREGAVVEALNPKTAAFFLAFVPQFIDPARGDVAAQFLVLGAISVVLNTAVDVGVAFGAGSLRDGLATRPIIMRRMREASGAVMCALGATLLFARRPAG